MLSEGRSDRNVAACGSDLGFECMTLCQLTHLRPEATVEESWRTSKNLKDDGMEVNCAKGAGEKGVVDVGAWPVTSGSHLPGGRLA